MHLVPPTIEDLLASPLYKFITFTVNGCRCSDWFPKIIVTAIHLFFLKAQSKANKEDNLNWLQVMNGPFIDEFFQQRNYYFRRKMYLGLVEQKEGKFHSWNLGFQMQVISQWHCEEMQSPLLLLLESAVRRDSFLWKLFPCCPMAAVCLMLILKNLLGLVRILHYLKYLNFCFLNSCWLSKIEAHYALKRVLRIRASDKSGMFPFANHLRGL